MVKCLFSYTHANKTQEFNNKMNVVRINLETNMEMNDFFFIHLCMDENNNCIYMFFKNRTSIKIMDECFILSLKKKFYNFN